MIMSLQEENNELKVRVAELEIEIRNQKEYVLLMHDRNNKNFIYGIKLYNENKKLKKEIDYLNKQLSEYINRYNSG
jgi:hypothetical protein